MLRWRDLEEVVELKRQGLIIQAISRLTGYDRTTISKYISAPAGRPVYGPRTPVESKLEPFKPYLKERLQTGVWNARVLIRELRERGYDGGHTILTDWLHPRRKEAESLAVRRFRLHRASRRRWTVAISVRYRTIMVSANWGASP